MDATYIGGKPRKTGKKDDDDHTPSKRRRVTNKQAVVGMIERKGGVKANIANANKMTFAILSSLVRKHVDANNATLYTDEYKSYSRMQSLIENKPVDHSQDVYSVDGVSTNSMALLWAIVK